MTLKSVSNRPSYRDADWYRTAGQLEKSQRMRLITACSILLRGDGQWINDAVTSELSILLEALAGDDLCHAEPVFTHQEIAVQALDDIMGSLQGAADNLTTIADGVDHIRNAVRQWPDEKDEPEPANLPSA